MSGLLSPIARALEQMADPVFMGVVLRSVVYSALSFIAVAALVWWGIHAAFTLPHWLAGLIGVMATAMAAFWLFIPVGIVIASLYSDRISEAVERRYYPGLPAPRGASIAAQGWDGIAVGLTVLGYMVLALILTIVIPGVGALLGWAIAAWVMGRGLFVSVAMRRMPRAQALRAFVYHRPQVLALGLVFAVAGLVPVLNLFVPVLGTAAMVHVLHRNDWQ